MDDLTSNCCGGAAMVFCECKAWQHHSVPCAAGERRWHVALPLFLSSLGLAVLSYAMPTRPWLAFGALLVTTLAWAPVGIIYSFPATFLSGQAARDTVFGHALPGAYR